jgi:hypothetical protein
MRKSVLDCRSMQEKDQEQESALSYTFIFVETEAFLPILSELTNYTTGDRGSTVVKVLRYESEGR